MNRFVLLLTGIAACSPPLSWCVAQEVRHEVAFPKGDAAWSVAFENTAAPTPTPAAGVPPATPPKKPVKVDIVRQGNLRRDTVVCSDGTTTQIWWCENPPVAMFDNGPKDHVSSMRASSMAQVRYDASSFEWVGAKSFAGMKPYKGKPGQYYEMEVIDDNDGEKTKRTLRAWIDPETHKPLALDNGFNKVAFLFRDDIPVEPLQMPANFLEKYRRLEAFFAPPRRTRK